VYDERTPQIGRVSLFDLEWTTETESLSWMVILAPEATPFQAPVLPASLADHVFPAGVMPSAMVGILDRSGLGAYPAGRDLMLAGEDAFVIAPGETSDVVIAGVNLGSG